MSLSSGGSMEAVTVQAATAQPVTAQAAPASQSTSGAQGSSKPQSSSGPQGSSGRRLRLRGSFAANELLTMFRRTRNLALLGALAAIPIALGIAIKVTTRHAD